MSVGCRLVRRSALGRWGMERRRDGTAARSFGMEFNVLDMLGLRCSKHAAPDVCTSFRAGNSTRRKKSRAKYSKPDSKSRHLREQLPALEHALAHPLDHLPHARRIRFLNTNLARQALPPPSNKATRASKQASSGQARARPATEGGGAASDLWGGRDGSERRRGREGDHLLLRLHALDGRRRRRCHDRAVRGKSESSSERWRNRCESHRGVVANDEQSATNRRGKARERRDLTTDAQTLWIRDTRAMPGWGALARGAFGLLMRMVPAVGMPGRPEANFSLVVREYPLEKDFVFVFVMWRRV